MVNPYILKQKKQLISKNSLSKIKKSPGLSLVDKRIDGGYVTPDESAGEDDVFISRMSWEVKKFHGSMGCSR